MARDLRTMLTRNGFWMTANMNTCLGRGVWDSILQYYKSSHDQWEPYVPSDQNENDAHCFASTRMFQATAQRTTSSTKPVSIETFESKDTAPAVRSLVHDLARRFLADGHYGFRVFFVSDMGASEPRLFRHDLAQLNWHQDKTEEIDNSFVFFAVLECSGCVTPSTNLLQIGSVYWSWLRSPPAPAVFQVCEADNHRVELVAETRGYSGSGYMIDQQWRGPTGRLLVHTHPLLSFAVQNFNSPGYRVRRAKIIVRIRRML